MALTKAVAGGLVAAFAVPTALAGHAGVLGDYVRRFSDPLTVGSFTLAWSWTLFAIVTLFAWGFLAWAEK
ncbi:MAG TPA: hypothetical protein VGB48_02035 [Allosphingosinicella sp.]|jgi:hypothetical protein